MDPDAAWAEALSNAWKVAHGPAEPDAAERCAEALLALDGWLRGDGFLPSRWTTERERMVGMLDADNVLAEALAAARAVLDEDDEGCRGRAGPPGADPQRLAVRLRGVTGHLDPLSHLVLVDWPEPPHRYGLDEHQVAAGRGYPGDVTPRM